MRFRCGALIFLCLAPSIGLAQEVKTNERLTYIDFSGHNLRAVSRNMKSYSRTEHAGREFFASTNVQFNYSLTPAAAESGCVLKNYDVIVDIEYEMPRWTRVKNAPQLDKFHWNKLYSAAWRHERIHGAIAEAMGDELAVIFSEVATETTCDLLTAAAIKAASEYLDGSTAQAAFDRYARNRSDPTDFDVAGAVRRN